ncbi:MFS transporter [Aquincola tertiaricarbonis]|uniref:MFS transporter n=1 Tax=Aquincola tertiaricarbonis TaxID=391953 RepID=UPI000615411B|nr:MFS transporter [Aquincola tertiaricarbonis]
MTSTLSADLRSARLATRLQFLAFGFITGSWGAHVPSAKAHYGLSEAQLSVALLAAALGAVACLLKAGAIVQWLGPRRVVQLAGTTACGVLASVLLPSSGQGAPLAMLPLLLLLGVFGAATALFDVAINAEGSLLETRGGLKVMSGFHGMWSLGAMGGAGVGGLLLKAQVPPLWQLAGACAVAWGVILAAAPRMLAEHPPAEHGEGGPRRWTALLVLLGLLAAAGLVAEGAIYDWSVLWITQDLQQTQSVGAAGYAAFAGAMALARFGGDWLRTHISAPRLLAGSGLLAAAAMSLALLSHSAWVAVPALAVVGAGLANVVPILFMAASRAPGVAPAAGIAAVSSLGYLGFVAGPPLIGGVAHASSLTGGMAVLVVASLVLAWGARRLPR